MDLLLKVSLPYNIEKHCHHFSDISFFDWFFVAVVDVLKMPVRSRWCHFWKGHLSIWSQYLSLFLWNSGPTAVIPSHFTGIPSGILSGILLTTWKNLLKANNKWSLKFQHRFPVQFWIFSKHATVLHYIAYYLIHIKINLLLWWIIIFNLIVSKWIANIQSQNTKAHGNIICTFLIQNETMDRITELPQSSEFQFLVEFRFRCFSVVLHNFWEKYW